MTDEQDVAKVAVGLTKARRDALCRPNESALTQRQSDRGTLADFGQPILDWSFRPARLTPLGIAVRNHLNQKGGL